MTDVRRSISFGLKTSQQGFAYDEILALWLEADRMPIFEHAWLWDHMLPLRGDVRQATLESWTLLGALAAQTTRLRLGVIVTSNRLRPPTVLAKMAATVDHISRGRLVLGIGAGGSRVADPAGMELVQREFDAYGIDIVSAAEALGARWVKPAPSSVACGPRLSPSTSTGDTTGYAAPSASPSRFSSHTRLS